MDFSRQSTNRKQDYSDVVTDVIAITLVFSVENEMNCVHNEPSLWDVNVEPSEEDRELSRNRIATKFFLTAKTVVQVRTSTV